MAGAIPPEINAAALAGAAPPAGLDEEEKRGLQPRRLLLQARSRLCPGDGEPAADALWARGFSDRLGRVDHRSRHLDLQANRPSVRRRHRGPDARRHSRQHHPLLADQHRGIVGPPVLGKQAGLLRSEGGEDPGRGERFPGGDMPGSAKVGRKGLSQVGLLQAPSERRALCRVGAAAGDRGRSSRRFQVAAVVQG